MARSTCQLLGRRLMQLKFTPGPQIYVTSKHHTKLQRKNSWPPSYIARMGEEGTCLRDTYWRMRGREAVTNQLALWFLQCSASPSLVGFYMDQLNFLDFVKKEIVWWGRERRERRESNEKGAGISDSARWTVRLRWSGDTHRRRKGPWEGRTAFLLYPWSTKGKRLSKGKLCKPVSFSIWFP